MGPTGRNAGREGEGRRKRSLLLARKNRKRKAKRATVLMRQAVRDETGVIVFFFRLVFLRCMKDLDASLCVCVCVCV